MFLLPNDMAHNIGDMNGELATCGEDKQPNIVAIVA